MKRIIEGEFDLLDILEFNAEDSIVRMEHLRREVDGYSEPFLRIVTRKKFDFPSPDDHEVWIRI